MSEDVYTRLREFLHNMPGGYPTTDSGVEIRILKKLFTPEDAEMTLHLKLYPEQASAIAERAGMDESEATRKLDALAEKGNIMRVKTGDDMVLYMALSFVVGIYELQLNTIDRELSEMVEEYMPHLGMVMASVKTKQMRVVPVASALEATPATAPYNQIREMVKNHTIASNALCICRKEQGLMGNECSRPHDLCLQFGMAAQHSIESGMAKEVSIDEALKLLDRAEENAMVPSVINVKDMLNVCCCCGCCCGLMRALKLLPNSADFVASAYQAKIDPDTCSGCETCLERCQVDAIKEDGDVMKIDLAKCIGCGLCVSYCPDEAISMMEKPGAPAPPDNIVTLMMQIMQERGLTI